MLLPLGSLEVNLCLPHGLSSTEVTLRPDTGVPATDIVGDDVTTGSVRQYGLVESVQCTVALAIEETDGAQALTVIADEATNGARGVDEFTIGVVLASDEPERLAAVLSLGQECRCRSEMIDHIAMFNPHSDSRSTSGSGGCGAADGAAHVRPDCGDRRRLPHAGPRAAQ